MSIAEMLDIIGDSVIDHKTVNELNKALDELAFCWIDQGMIKYNREEFETEFQKVVKGQRLASDYILASQNEMKISPKKVEQFEKVTQELVSTNEDMEMAPFRRYLQTGEIRPLLHDFGVIDPLTDPEMYKHTDYNYDGYSVCIQPLNFNLVRKKMEFIIFVP